MAFDMKLRNERKKRAVFLDRDGVLTVEKGYVCSIEQLEIFPFARECVEVIHKNGYLAIVLTNQSGVARGYFSENELMGMNQYLIENTGVDMVYYCPHYEHGVVDSYAVKCGCRKPEIGMIRKACREYAVELSGSYMVGDRAGDILCGQKAGLKTVLVESGYGSGKLEVDVKADYYMKDLQEFVNILCLEKERG